MVFKSIEAALTAYSDSCSPLTFDEWSNRYGVIISSDSDGSNDSLYTGMNAQSDPEFLDEYLSSEDLKEREEYYNNYK